MAFSSSGLFVSTFIDVFDGTQTHLDLTLTTHKVALFNNSITPNYSTDTRYNVGNWSNTNEMPGTGNYTQGGTLLTGGTPSTPTVSESPSSVLMWDAGDVSWASSTINGAYGCLIYADALTAPFNDPVICAVAFGGSYSTTSGTFTIIWNSLGIFTVDLY